MTQNSAETHLGEGHATLIMLNGWGEGRAVDLSPQFVSRVDRDFVRSLCKGKRAVCCAEIEHNIGVKSSTFLRRVCCIVCDKCACAVGSINNAARVAPDLKRGPAKRATQSLALSSRRRSLLPVLSFVPGRGVCHGVHESRISLQGLLVERGVKSAPTCRV